jgi:hypothetical protein
MNLGHPNPVELVTPLTRHTGESRDPVLLCSFWIPIFIGMTIIRAQKDVLSFLSSDYTASGWRRSSFFLSLPHCLSFTLKNAFFT